MHLFGSTFRPLPSPTLRAPRTHRRAGFGPVHFAFSFLTDWEWGKFFQRSLHGRLVSPVPHAPAPAWTRESQHPLGTDAWGGTVRARQAPYCAVFSGLYLAVGCSFTSPGAQCRLEKGCSIIKNRSMKDYLHFKNS